MSDKRVLRYLAPNLITTGSLLFGLLSVAATLRGDYNSAGWFIIYAVLADRLDGFVARLVRGTSELGQQLDSFADFLNFGLAPAFLVYAALSRSPALPFTHGAAHTMLLIACVAWVLAAVFRLARYNITDDVPSPIKLPVFFGVPTTLAGGLLVVWFLALYKYAPEGAVFPARPTDVGGMRFLGGVETPMGVWRYFPVAMFVGAYLMVSSLRMPKLGLMRSRVASTFVYINVLAGGTCGLARVFPEYMMLLPSLWLVVFLIWGQVSPAARSMRPPPVFPPAGSPPGGRPVPAKDDILPAGAEPEKSMGVGHSE